MKYRARLHGVPWILGTIQYCACLFGGGGLWLLAAYLTGFFGGDLAAQGVALLLLLALITVEAGWAHLSVAGARRGDFVVDFVSSAAIAGFGMVMVVAILAWLPH
jgi:hypothetical protein